jgi:hypothetical protein
VLECGVRAGAAEELKCGVGLPSRWRRGLCCPRGRENERAGRCRCACRWPARAQAMPRRPPPQWSPDLLLRLRQPPAASSQQPAAAAASRARSRRRLRRASASRQPPAASTRYRVQTMYRRGLLPIPSTTN